MPAGTYRDFRDALRAFESGWDRQRYAAGNIVDAQLDQWAGGPVTAFYPAYDSWSDLSDAEWTAMSYRSTNSLGFVGYQFGEPLLIDLGYYDDDVFYGAGAATNTWDGAWTGKNGVDSLDEFKTEAAQEVAIQEAFGYNLKIIADGLAASGRSLADYLGTSMSFQQDGRSVSVEITLTGILAAAHLRGAYGLLNLLQNGSVSTDEFGTSILQYMQQFGGYDAPGAAEVIAFFDDRVTGDEGVGPVTPTPGGEGGGGEGGTGTAGVDAASADVVVTWRWGSKDVVGDFDPATDTIFVDWIGADQIEVAETANGVVFAIPSNEQTITLAGVSLSDLSPANFTFRDATAAQEVFALIGGGTGTGDDGAGDGTDDGGDTGPTARTIAVSLTSASATIEDFDVARDVVRVAAGVTDQRLQIFEESGDALGQTVRLAVLGEDGRVQSTLVLKGVGLADLSPRNFAVAEQSALNEISAALGDTEQPEPLSGGFPFSYDSDGSSPPRTSGATAAGGVKYVADTNADDIANFDAGRDQLDFGGTSVHGIIVTKSPAGEVVVDYPWAAAQQVLRGVSFADLGIEGFGVVGNEHLRQDIGGVVSWELGVGPRNADTVYVRSHEYGKHEVVGDFDPATMKLSFLYFGTREQLTVRDTDAGLTISSLPTGQSLTLTGVKLADLAPGRVEFHHDQVDEDNLEAAFGFAPEDVTLVSRASLLTPDAPAGQATDGWQTRTGRMTPGGGTSDGGGTDPDTGDDHDHDDHDHDDDGHDGGGGGAGDVTTVGWDWGAKPTIAGFDPATDAIDFGQLQAGQFRISEDAGDLLIEVLDNGGHVYRFDGIQAEDLTRANVDAAAFNGVIDADGGVADQLVALRGDYWVS